MLPVIIFEPDSKTRNHLAQCVCDYCQEHESSMQLLANTSSIDDAVKFFKGENGVTLLMLSIAAGRDESRRGAVQLGRQAIRRNRDNYTLYCLHNVADLEALLNTGVRPAGVLVNPFEKIKLEKLLARIDRDYEELREEADGNCMVVDSGNTTYRLPYSKVLYIEALDKKLQIWTNRQCLTVRMTLNNLEETLPPDVFFRCHRSFMVNIHAIDHVDFTAMELVITTGDSLPLSRSCRDKLREILDAERNKSHGA